MEQWKKTDWKVNSTSAVKPYAATKKKRPSNFFYHFFILISISQLHSFIVRVKKKKIIIIVRSVQNKQKKKKTFHSSQNAFIFLEKKRKKKYNFFDPCSMQPLFHDVCMTMMMIQTIEINIKEKKMSKLATNLALFSAQISKRNGSNYDWHWFISLFFLQ